MENIIIEEKQSKVIRAYITCVIMAVISALILVFGLYSGSLIYKLIGTIGIIYFVIASISCMTRMCKPKALFTITLEGIVDTSSTNSYGYIAFQEIEKFDIVNVFGQQVIGVQLKDPNRFVQTLSGMKQKSFRTNIRMKLPPITLRVDTAKDMSIEDIVSLLQKRLSDYSSLYS